MPLVLNQNNPRDPPLSLLFVSAGFCLLFWHDISIAIEFSAVPPCERWVVFNVVLRCLSTCWGFPFHPTSPAAAPGSDSSLLGEAVPCEGHSHEGCWHHLLPNPFPIQSAIPDDEIPDIFQMRDLLFLTQIPLVPGMPGQEIHVLLWCHRLVSPGCLHNLWLPPGIHEQGEACSHLQT